MSNTTHQALIESFCSFIEFQADRFRHRVVDTRLRISMERHLVQSVELSEKFWALYWYGSWKEQQLSDSDRQTDDVVPAVRRDLARSHLIAHLQDPCYWAAEKASRYITDVNYRLSDCFQLLSSQVDRILGGFKPERGASLKGYAQMAMPTLIRDILRQRQDAELCTNWALLRRISKRQLNRALKQAGLLEPAIAEYRLAWNCYKACSGPSTLARSKGVTSLEADALASMVHLYNQERLSQLLTLAEATTPSQLEQRLSQIAIWVRASLQPPITSLNAPRPSADGIELQDSLSDSEHESLVSQLIVEEETQQRRQQQADLNKVLREAILALPTETQQLLTAYYKDQLPQREIAQTLNIKQYTVSRRLTRIRESLLNNLVRWSKESMHISLTPDQVFSLSTTLEDWLSQYYGLAAHSSLGSPVLDSGSASAGATSI